MFFPSSPLLYRYRRTSVKITGSALHLPLPYDQPSARIRDVDYTSIPHTLL